jgi:type VI secretion system secreted protein VgrG
MVTQTVGNELCTVGPQSFAIGGSEKVSVKQVYRTGAASQSLSVGGSQTIRVTGDMSITTGSESVAVGGLLFEKVGNPINGVIALAEAAALHGAGEKLGSMLENLGPVAQGVLGTAIGPGLAAVDGAVHGAIAGGANGAAEQGGLAAAQAALGHIPGMDAVTAAVLGTGFAPWNTAPDSDGKGEAAPGGGAAGPSAAPAGPAGPGPGHRVTNVDASMSEFIGGAHGVLTPGMIRWTTLGRSTFLVGGSHNIQAASVSVRTMGASADKAASVRMNALAGDVVREVKTVMRRKVDGSLTVSAGEDYRLEAGAALKLEIGGSLSLAGGEVVFQCGSSTFAVSSGGVLLKASSVTINEAAQQSGKATTP